METSGNGALTGMTTTLIQSRPIPVFFLRATIELSEANPGTISKDTCESLQEVLIRLPVQHMMSGSESVELFVPLISNLSMKSYANISL